MGPLTGRPKRGLQEPGKRRLAVNGPVLGLHLLGLFRGDRYAWRLWRQTDHLAATNHWPA